MSCSMLISFMSQHDIFSRTFQFTYGACYLPSYQERCGFTLWRMERTETDHPIVGRKRARTETVLTPSICFLPGLV
jgi:hypothetical protein